MFNYIGHQKLPVVNQPYWKFRRGYKEQEIEEAFKKFDLDGNRVLDSQEQAEMLKALEDEKVRVIVYLSLRLMLIDLVGCFVERC